ncbi:hypothetical protein D3C77_670690 [compost metagenome]
MADVHVDTQVLAPGIGIGKARQAVADAALHEALALHRIQRRAGMGQAADAQQRSGAQQGQSGFHHFHLEPPVAFCCVGVAAHTFPVGGSPLPATTNDEPVQA